MKRCNQTILIPKCFKYKGGENQRLAPLILSLKATTMLKFATKLCSFEQNNRSFPPNFKLFCPISIRQSSSYSALVLPSFLNASKKTFEIVVNDG